MLRQALFVLAAALSVEAAQYDILIRNARIIDGAGNPWYRADIGITGGRIAAIGALGHDTASRTIDAAQRVVAPGFIDVHTHIEGGIDKRPAAENFLLDGVTSVVTGNCGGSETNLANWFAYIEQQHSGINVASLIGHNSVRSAVMGRANRLATPEEIGKMQALIEKAMQDGAVGFSTGLIYIPGTYSNTDEVVSLAKAAAKYHGVYASHMRDEGPEIVAAINEAVQVGRETGMPVELSHFKIDTKSLWGMSEKTLALVENYRREGVDVVVDQYPYERSSTNLGTQLPSWALADGQPAIKERLASPETRARIVKEMIERVKRKGMDDWSFAYVANYKPDATVEGKSIAEINVSKGRPKTLESEANTILEMVAAGGAQMVYHTMGDTDIERIMKWPFTAVASDAGVREPGEGVPHPRGYATNSRVLAEYVRKRKVITLEDAIRRMTSLPARTFSLSDRGLVREGMAADLVIFDPAKVQDKSTYTQPHQYTEGMDFVLVNGKVAVADGKVTAERGGQILRHAVKQ